MILRDIYKKVFINTTGMVYELPNFSIMEEVFVLTRIEVLCGRYNIRLHALTFTPINKEIERSVVVSFGVTCFIVERRIASAYRRYVAYRSSVYQCDVIFTNSSSNILSQIIPENDLKKYSRIRKGCAITKTDDEVSVVWIPD